ncbi:serine/threonine-protein kinase [Anaeromyxobacter oryzae]|uniref:Uncharacterized protein n=1 Tax=Anaeromyxobacter oryzae TaxID=2918170 RepID=A0ABM7X204_9BACT|nr:hypothetical protein [Anaeromyxobacter oryzae]BDG05774.1 hypothetical protein AMOR_47700 [Anaeromyxobacter oryzae]
MDPQRPDAPAPRARPGIAARAVERLRASARNAAHGATVVARFLWARRPPALRAVGAAFALALAIAGAAGILFEGGLPDRLPAAMDWAALRALVERDARPGDALALSPAWAERARLAAPGTVPVLTPASWADDDVPGVKRAWLVSAPRAPGFSWRTEKALLARASRNDPPIPLGALEVTRYELAAPELPLAFLPDRLSRAEVQLGDAPCARDGVGFRCPTADGGTVEVVRTMREVGGAPRPCLTAPAEAGAGAPLTITFPALPIGRTLRGHAGIAGDPARARDAAVRIAVRIDGEEAGAADVAGAGWRTFAIDTGRFAGRMREVALVVGAPGPTGPLCLDAVTLP